MEDKLKEAVKIYDKIAKIYHENNYHKLMQFQLNKFISLLKGKKVLDIGCGPGRDVEYLTEDGLDVIGIDISENMINEAKKNFPEGKFKIMDFRKMNFKDNSFDGVWSMASFYHIDKKEASKVLKEFSRILNKKGVLYMAIKEGKGKEKSTNPVYGETKEYYGYQKEEIDSLLTETDFSIITSEVNETDEGEKWIEIYARKK